MLTPLLNRCFYKCGVPVVLESAPGQGKTAMVENWCKVNNIPLVKILASSMDETDIAGVMVPKDERAVNLTPQWADTLKDRGVLFLDEINTARKEVQDTLLTLVQSRQFPNGAKLGDGVLIIAALNPAEMCDNYEMSPALRSRFAWFKMADSYARFVAWVTGQEINLSAKASAPVKFVTFGDWLNRFQNDPNFEADKKALLVEAGRLGMEFTADDCIVEGKQINCRRAFTNLLYWTANAYEMVKWASAFIDDNSASILASVNLESVQNVANAVFTNSNRKTVKVNEEEEAYNKSQSNILGRINNAVQNS